MLRSLICKSNVLMGSVSNRSSCPTLLTRDGYSYVVVTPQGDL